MKTIGGYDIKPGADLIGACLVGADLHEAKLHVANLHGANLGGAAGIIALHVGDPRGYRAVAVLHDAGWMIAAGCRWYTSAEALAHWGADDYHSPALGAAYVRAIRGQLEGPL